MTTPSTASSRLRWWQWIGPWPLRPWPVTIFTTVFALATTSYTLTVPTAPATVGSALAVGAVSGISMYFFQRLAPRLVETTGGYLFALGVVSLATVGVRQITGTILEFSNFGPIANFTFTWLRAVIFAGLLLALLGSSQRKLQLQIERTDAALEATRAQAEALLEADESVRHQVSLLLHDRVQAGLIAACLQLRRTLGGDQERDVQVSRVVEQLEQLRALDVRRAVHALSPNLREVDLLTAMDELADTYRPAMQVQITIDDAVEVPEEQRLGIYRIVEQALLNAAVHGNAAHCDVTLTSHAGELQLQISDNGTGLAVDPRAGFGSTLIDTWCRVLGGSWARVGGSPGTLVIVSLPTH